MDVDAILQEVGSFGTYQKLLVALLCFPFAFAMPYTFMGQLFQSLIPHHWCNVPELMELSVNDRNTLSIPMEKSDEGFRFTQCYMYDRNYTELALTLESNISHWILNGSVLNDFTSGHANDSIIRCTSGWEYDFMTFRPTVASDYDWVCEQDWKPYVSLAIFFIGSCVGAALFGYISDTYGRAPTVLISNAVAGLANLVTAFTQGFISFSIVRFFAGLTFDIATMSFYILVMEYLEPNKRTICSCFPFGIFYAAGSVLLPWIAYFLPNWRYYSGVIAVPFLLVVPFYKYIPESVRWLVVANRFDDALKQLKDMARINKKEVKEEIWEQAMFDMLEEYKQEKSNKKYTYLDLFKNPKLRLRTIIVTLIWFVVMLSYDGLVRNTENLGWDVFKSSTLGNAIELPAAILAWLLLDRIGRRLTSIGGLAFATLFCLLVLLLPPGMTWLFVTLAVMARMMITIMMNVMWQYKAELFPTVVRGQGISFAHLVGFIGSMASPFIVYLGHSGREYPLIIFGILSGIGAILAAILPETLYEDLPESLEDGEALGANQPFFYFPRKIALNKKLVNNSCIEMHAAANLNN